MAGYYEAPEDGGLEAHLDFRKHESEGESISDGSEFFLIHSEDENLYYWEKANGSSLLYSKETFKSEREAELANLEKLTWED